MKRLVLGAVAIAAAVLAMAAPASAAEYDFFVGCDDLAEFPTPAHVCQFEDFPAAYFEADEDTEYDVCVEYPDGSEICAEDQFAEAEVLYLNSIFTEMPGNHVVTWYLGSLEIGSWIFRLEPPAPPAPVDPPPAPTPTPAPAPAPTVAPAPAKSAACVKAERTIKQLKSQLQNASGKKQKARLRGKLRGTRTALKKAC